MKNDENREKKSFWDLRNRMKWFYWFYFFENILVFFLSINIHLCDCVMKTKISQIIIISNVIQWTLNTVLNIFLSAWHSKYFHLLFILLYWQQFCRTFLSIDYFHIVHIYLHLLVSTNPGCCFFSSRLLIIGIRTLIVFPCENENCCLQTMVTFLKFHRRPVYNLKLVRRLIIYLLLWNFLGFWYILSKQIIKFLIFSLFLSFKWVTATDRLNSQDRIALMAS